MDSERITEEQPLSPQESLPAQFTFVIANDKMAAYMRTAAYKGQVITEEEILAAIGRNQIRYGIDRDEIAKFAADGNYLREIKVASGLRPIKGEDGFVEYHFRKRVSGMPKERQDGTVDFKNLDLVQNVAKGDVLCTVYQPKEGTNGVDVFGMEVKAAMGDLPTIPGGADVRYDKDTGQVFAQADGGIHFRYGDIFIEQAYTVDDVGPETGNIDYNGSVTVNGFVMEGFSVSAKKDITVRGIVEGASLKAGGDILLKSGTNGMGKATIEADGDITSVFLENATAKCGGSLYADVLMNCSVNAGEGIKLRGKKGAIIGGTYRAGEYINVKSIGNEKHLQQELTVDPCWYEYEKMGLEQRPEAPEIQKQRLMDKRSQLEEKSRKISADMRRATEVKDYQKPLDPEERKEKMRLVLERKTEVSQAIEQIDAELKELDKFLVGHDFKIICTKDIFPGTRLTIGNAKLRIGARAQNQKYYVFEGEIVSGTILPGESE